MAKKTPSARELLRAKLHLDTVKAAAEAKRQQSYAAAYQRCLDYIATHAPGSAATTADLVVAAYTELAGQQRADETYAATVAAAAEQIMQKLTGLPALYRVVYTLVQEPPSGRRPPISKLQQAAANREALLLEAMQCFENKYASKDVRISRVTPGTDSFAVTAPTRQLLEELPEQFSDCTKAAITSAP